MKRILIVNNNMHIGGVQKALLNLLQTLHADYDITLLLFYRGGAAQRSAYGCPRVCCRRCVSLFWHDEKRCVDGS